MLDPTAYAKILFDENLIPIEDAPGYARSVTGRVYKFGKTKDGRYWRGLRETAERTIERLPGCVTYRRSGRFYFPIFRRGLPMERLFWVPTTRAAMRAAEVEDDCPF